MGRFWSDHFFIFFLFSEKTTKNLEELVLIKKVPAENQILILIALSP